SSGWRQAETLARVLAGLHLRAPVPVVQVPLYRATQAPCEIVRGLPAELGADLPGVDRVAPVVPGAIGDEALQRGVRGHAPRRERRVGPGGEQVLEDGAQPVDDLQVRPLVAPPDVVLLAEASALEHEEDAGAVVLDVET